MAPKKRSRPSAASATSAGPTGSRRTSQRLSAGAAAKKSKYFEPDSDEGGDDHDEDDYDGNEDDDTDDTEGSVEDYSSDEDKRSRKKARPTPQKRAAAAKAAKEKVTKSKYEDKDDGYDNAPGSDEDESGKDDEDEEPRTRFIPKKQLRPEGNVKYADDRIHPNTMAFLRDLKANNKRSWLKGK